MIYHNKTTSVILFIYLLQANEYSIYLHIHIPICIFCMFVNYMTFMNNEGNTNELERKTAEYAFFSVFIFMTVHLSRD
jgi:hypothetical protein